MKEVKLLFWLKVQDGLHLNLKFKRKHNNNILRKVMFVLEEGV